MSNEQVSNVAIAPNTKRLLWAGFMAILAAGVGFALRGAIFDNWAREFGFTGAQLGAIGGAGFSGSCFGIIIGGVICDKVGYGKLVMLAFALHVLSAIVTFTAGGDTAYNSLYWGMFIFAYANGTLEAVANPMVATLFPSNRTHYLNILHASWPAGLVIGGVLGWVLDDKMNLPWKWQLSLYLIPTVVYGVMFLGQHMPKSEASVKGLKLGEMLKEVGMMGAALIALFIWLFSRDALGPMLGGLTGAVFFTGPSWGYVAMAIGAAVWLWFSGMSGWAFGSLLLLVLFATHVLVGAVELGTDGWIQNITGNILTSEQGKILFVFTSATMFTLRFCAGFIERRIGLSPVGILLACAILACVGLNLASGITTFGGALLALGIYAVGKTFFWPTMLAVTSDRFPRTGAVAISIMGGLGMMSAGLVGSPGLGYAKDRFASEALAQENPAVYAEYKVAEPKGWLIFKPVAAIDGKKLEEAKAAVTAGKADEKQKMVHDADQTGDRRTLKADSFIPATMAVVFLLLFLYVKAKGGYQRVHLVEEPTGTAT
ncbi:MAG: MFS transporter [Opitutaceae bacterium]|nr:MFS transporter [Opitutaceae bacterium]